MSDADGGWDRIEVLISYCVHCCVHLKYYAYELYEYDTCCLNELACIKSHRFVSDMRGSISWLSVVSLMVSIFPVVPRLDSLSLSGLER